MHAIAPRFVGGGGNDAPWAEAPDDDRLSPVFLVVTLLNRREKCVHIHMQYPAVHAVSPLSYPNFQKSLCSAEKLRDFFLAELRQKALSRTYHLVDEGFFLFLQGKNFLLYSPLCYQLQHLHVLFLSDSVGAVSCLVLHGRIPPRVEMYDHIGSREVESRTPCLEGNQKHGNAPRVKLLYESKPRERRRCPVEIAVVKSCCLKASSDALQHSRKLRKNQHTVSRGCRITKNFLQKVKLSRAAVIVFKEK